MQHRTSPPCTQSGASVEFRVVILVLSKHFFVFSARVSLKQRAIKTRTPTRHRRIITPRSGLGTFSARLVFWKAEIEARTSVPLPGTCGSRRARPVRIFHGAFHTTVSTGTSRGTFGTGVAHTHAVQGRAQHDTGNAGFGDVDMAQHGAV